MCVPAGYSPDPRGMLSAREAVVDYYGDLGVSLSPASVVLTASTSEAYSWLFTMLASPGERILTPRPSYPLFGALAQLAGVELVPYSADDPVRGVRAGLEGGAVAVIAVHPNNPTGQYARCQGEVAALVRRHGAALIADEVFYDFGLATQRPPTHAAASECLTFTLSGLSKVVGLPGFKLGWVVATGPGAERALEALEFLADTFLSVNVVAQHALPSLLAGRRVFQERVLRRLDENLRRLGPRFTPPEGGWTACLPLPPGANDEHRALDLLAQGVLVHPGYFFDFEPDRPALVLSLLTPPERLEAALPALSEHLA